MPPRLLSDAAVDAALSGLAWSRDGNVLVKTVVRRDFAEALAYVNEVGRLAEEVDHHPDVAISWNRVELRLWTHVAGGLTQSDLDLAGRIDQLG